MQVVGDLIQQDAMARIAREIRRPGIDVVREQARRAPLKIERMQDAVADSVRNGEECENGSHPQRRQRQQPIQPRVGMVAILDSRSRLIFRWIHGCALPLLGVY